MSVKFLEWRYTTQPFHFTPDVGRHHWKATSDLMRALVVNYFFQVEAAMSAKQFEEIKSAALGLPENDRIKLANERLASLHGNRDADIAAGWDIEICRRINEIQIGNAEKLDGYSITTICTLTTPEDKLPILLNADFDKSAIRP